MAKARTLRIKIGGINYCWNATEKTYPKDILKELGIELAKDTDDNMVFGGTPKPPIIVIILENGKRLRRFCDASKIEDLTSKGTLNGKKWGNVGIKRVTNG